MSKHESVDNTEPVTTYIDAKTLVALEKKAAQDERTLSSVVRLLIKRYISGNFECRKTDEE